MQALKKILRLFPEIVFRMNDMLAEYIKIFQSGVLQYCGALDDLVSVFLPKFRHGILKSVRLFFAYDIRKNVHLLISARKIAHGQADRADIILPRI